MVHWEVAGDASGRPTEATCAHLDGVGEVPAPSALECVDCVVEGSSWVHLRQCLSCGEVRCCDQSPRHHATTHFSKVPHPLMRSAQPDEDWGWCYVDELFLLPV
jgi:uncharacterized UBP type Zn finger protein